MWAQHRNCGLLGLQLRFPPSEAEGFIFQLQTCSVILNVSNLFFFFFLILNAARENLSAEDSLPAQMKVELVCA